MARVSLGTFIGLVSLVIPAVAQAQPKPAMTWNPANPRNYSATSGRTINSIVIHKAEGTLAGTVSWFKNANARVSSHYVLDAAQIVQMVEDKNRCWHAGNSYYNSRAIGIENAGWTFRNDMNDAHYKRLASLVAWLCAKHSIPVDRQHIIGHAEVPNENRPGRFGGTGGHEDPGPYFDWTKFMSYVRQAGGGTFPVPPAPTPPPPAPIPGNGGVQAVAVAVDLLNVRDRPWGTVVGSVANNTAWVRTKSAPNQGFIEIYFRGGKAWVSAGHTKGFTGPGATITTDQLNVRDQPSVSSTVIGKAHSGQVYAKGDVSPDGQWITIRYDTFRRWVSRGYTSDVALRP